MNLCITYSDEAQPGQLKAHDILVTMTSGVIARACALGLVDMGRVAAMVIHKIGKAWGWLLYPFIKPEVYPPLTLVHF